MEELSFIKQGDQIIYLKDATGRSMLAEKQNKLKAGAGIEIAEDGTISVGGWKKVTVENIGFEGQYGDYIYNLEFEYYGNPALIKQDFQIGSCEPTFEKFDNGSSIPLIYIHGTSNFVNHNILEGLQNIPDNGLSWLIIKPLSVTCTFDSENRANEGSSTSLDHKIIYIEDDASYMMLSENGYWEKNTPFEIKYSQYSCSSDAELAAASMVSKLLNLDKEIILAR